MGTKECMQAYGFSAASVLWPRCKQLAIGCAHSASGVMLILAVLQPPLSNQVSDSDAV